MKRACDRCIERKVRCDGEQPCSRCQQTQAFECTFLKPALKRGPKSTTISSPKTVSATKTSSSAIKNARRPVPLTTLNKYISIFAFRLYSVWPVLDSNHLINRLESSTEDIEAYVLALALSSATSSQLQLPIIGADSSITATYMATESIRIRSTYDFREKPTYYATLVPFFLHVHHATLLKFRSSMMFLQEAISFAKLFEIEVDSGMGRGDQSESDDLHTLLCLLWVTERGYAFQGNFPMLSAGRSIPTSSRPLSDLNPHKRDLLHLASLFAAFEIEPMRRLPSQHPNETSLERLQILQQRLAEAPDYLSNLGSTSYVDYIVTQQWMRTVLWQKSMSQGYLSFNSAIECMRYNYPVRVMHDLLKSIPQIERETIVAGGQDQILKLFEVSNNLADLILCSPISSKAARLEDKSAMDFLAAICNGIFPCLGKYQIYREILGKKIGDIYLKSRLKNINLGGGSGDLELVDDVAEEAVDNGWNEGWSNSTAQGNEF